MMVMCAACNVSFVIHAKYADEEGALRCPRCNEPVPDVRIKPADPEAACAESAG